MLHRARRRAAALGADVDLRQMDVQRLEFPDASFDAIVATFVFCSVPEPVQGLRELGRVVKRNGEIWLLEHVRVNRPVVDRLMDAVNPMVVRLMGANINRQTADNVRRAGLAALEVEPVRGELVQRIRAGAGVPKGSLEGRRPGI